MSAKTIFGREPAVAIGLIEAIVAFALTIQVGWWGWDAQTDAIIMAFVVALGGLWGAWVTSETMLGALLGVLKAGFALALAFNFALSSTQQAMAISIVSAVVAFAYRTQTTPAAKPAKAAPAAPVAADSTTLR